jgi:DNA-binding HxlR family transcriptional regulator
VILININTLFEIADIFRFRWDPATLACLGERPMRFRALARRLGTRIGDRVEDNALSRSLTRLQRTGLIAATRTAVGRRVVPMYHLTDKGRDRLAQYQALAFTYQEIAIPNGDSKTNGQTYMHEPSPTARHRQPGPGR